MTLYVQQKNRFRRSKPIQFFRKSTVSFKTSLKDFKENKYDRFLLMCKSTQCIFCFGNKRKSYQKKTTEYARLNKIINEIERHLKNFVSNDSISCFHFRCTISNSVFSHVTTFKNHIVKMHKILLRA